MIKRILDIGEPAYLHIERSQLIVKKEGVKVAQIPVEDLGLIVLESPAIVITQSTIISCQKNNVAIVFCDEKRMPCSVIFPLTGGNTLHTKVLRNQITTKKSIKKSLWKQIVQEKITAQALLLSQVGRPSQAIARLSEKVRSGDPENCEAQAAKIYWRKLFGDDFRRNTELGGINALLNYGYAIVRALIARAIVGTGLHPALGLQHSNQYNGFCLADDIIEPLRPWVDQVVVDLVNSKCTLEISRDTKAKLLGLIHRQVILNGKTMPLLVASHLIAAQLKRALSDKNERLLYPALKTN